MKFAFRPVAATLLASLALALTSPARASETAAKPRAETRLPSPGDEAMGDIILQAMSLMGIAYRFGGNNPSQGFDCSGFVRYIFSKSAGINLPRTAGEQAQHGRPVSRDDLQPGDIVFFNTRGFAFSHNGLYIGNGKFIHAPRTGKNIEIASINASYWSGRFNGARRVSRSAGGREFLADQDAAPRKPSDTDPIASFADNGSALAGGAAAVAGVGALAAAKSATGKQPAAVETGKSRAAPNTLKCPPPKKGLSTRDRKRQLAACEEQKKEQAASKGSAKKSAASSKSGKSATNNKARTASKAAGKATSATTKKKTGTSSKSKSPTTGKKKS